MRVRPRPGGVPQPYLTESAHRCARGRQVQRCPRTAADGVCVRGRDARSDGPCAASHTCSHIVRRSHRLATLRDTAAGTSKGAHQARSSRPVAQRATHAAYMITITGKRAAAETNASRRPTPVRQTQSIEQASGRQREQQAQCRQLFPA